MFYRGRVAKSSLTLGVLTTMVSFLIAGSAVTNAADEQDAATSDAEPQKVTVATIGKLAPDFTLTDEDGTEYSLSDYKGKIVVLEWYNPDCPYVKAAHMKGALKDQGNDINAEKDKVWLAIN